MSPSTPFFKPATEKAAFDWVDDRSDTTINRIAELLEKFEMLTPAVVCSMADLLADSMLCWTCKIKDESTVDSYLSSSKMLLMISSTVKVSLVTNVDDQQDAIRTIHKSKLEVSEDMKDEHFLVQMVTYGCICDAICGRLSGELKKKMDEGLAGDEGDRATLFALDSMRGVVKQAVAGGMASVNGKSSEKEPCKTFLAGYPA